MARRALAFAATALLAGCAIPPRDNDRDPANIPNPPGIVLEVFVDGVESTLGQRNSRWEFDAAASDAPDDACFQWSLSNGFADDPRAIDEAEWTELVAAEDAPCATPVATLVSTSNAELGNALAAVSDFDLSGPIAGSQRWMRLTIEKAGGGDATVYKAITVVNQVPEVSLGPDRRTAPGGRWWLTGESQRFVNVLTAAIGGGDPDPILDIRWRVTGELATRLDLENEFAPAGSTTDGYVDTSFYVEGSPRLELPMSIDPSRSEITVEVRDFIGPGGVSATPAGTSTVKVDVLSTVWAYDSATAHLRRIDSSQFLSGFSLDDQEPFAYDGTSILWANADGTQIHLNRLGRGLQARSTSLLAELILTEGDFTANTNLQIRAIPAVGGGWWIHDGRGGRLYKVAPNFASAVKLEDVFTANVGPLSEQRDFYAGNNGGYSGLAAGASGRVWVLGGELAGTDTDGQRVLLVRPDATNTIGGALVAPPVDPFPDATVAGFIAADGTGGVFVASSTDRKLAHVTVNAMNVTAVDQLSIPDGCVGPTETIGAMASDPSRNALWLGVFTNDPASEGICRIDTSNLAAIAFSRQKSASASVLTIRPSDGSAYMSANFGQGMNRYAPFSAASLEYIPLQAGKPNVLGLSVQKAMFVDDNLLATVSEQFPSFYDKRAIMVEAAEIHEPVDIDLAIDPYVMKFERHVTDPVTGFALVWLPDTGRVAVFAPDGTRLMDVEIGYTEQRAHLAWDPDARRLWLAFSELWQGNRTPAVAIGRLLYADVPEDFGATLDVPSIDAVEIPDVQVAMSRGMAVIPSSAPNAPGRLCWAADLLGEPIPDARVRTRESDGGDTGETPFELASGQDTEVWVSADPTTGECWAGTRGSTNSFVRLLPNGDAETVSSGIAIRHAALVGPGKAFALSTTTLDEVALLDTDSSDVTTDNPVFEPNLTGTLSLMRGGAVDPYWEHAWMSFEDDEGNIIRMTIGEAPHEAWREQGINLPRIDNGR